MKKFNLILLLLMFGFLISPISVFAKEALAEDIPAAEDTPAAEDVPFAESIPAIEEVPSTEGTPVAEIPATKEIPIAFGPPATIAVCRNLNVCFVFDDACQLINSFPVSTGRSGHETPLGVFKIYQHTTGEGYHPMVDGTYGRYCMRFLKGGYMFHSVCYAYPGAPDPIPQEVADIGQSVSRGCVRLKVSDAAWLYNATPDGCLVIIFDYQAPPP